MNTNTIRRIATATLSAGLVFAPAIGLAATAAADEAPAVVAYDDDTLPTPAEAPDLDPSLGIVAITTEVGTAADPVLYDCDTLDESVRVPVEGQEGKCTLDRSGLARAIDNDDVQPATVPDLDPNLGIMPISIGIGAVPGSTDNSAATAGKWLSIALSAVAVGGTAYSFLHDRRRVEA